MGNLASNGRRTLANLERVGLMRWAKPGLYEKNGYRLREIIRPTRSEWCVLAVPITEKSGSRKFTAYADGFVRSAPKAVPDPKNAREALKLAKSPAEKDVVAKMIALLEQGKPADGQP